MTMKTKEEIFKKYITEYIKVNRKRKNEILDTVCEVTDIHRKSAIRKFKSLQLDDGSGHKKRGRKKLYSKKSFDALETIWTTLGGLCGELIHPVIFEMTERFEQQGEWWHDLEATEQVKQMSLSTVKRYCSKLFKENRTTKGKSSTKPAHIKSIIPIFKGPWDDKPPGYGQIDTVVHCGNTLSGSMVYSVNYTDVATSWVVLAAQWNKSQESTLNSLIRMKSKLPFPVLGMHPDSGSEFVNFHLKAWCVKEDIELTRSRPSHSNDNAYVEQKNGHVIRRFLGYERFDTEEIAMTINCFYDELELHINHFVPTRKCIEKIRVGSKYRRKYDIAKTPYKRVMENTKISEEKKLKLKAIHEKLNPVKLKIKIEKEIKKIQRIQRRSNKNT